MKITYSNTKQDIIEWQLYNSENAPHFQNQIKKNRLIISGAIFLFFSTVAYWESDIVYLIAGLAAAVGYFMTSLSKSSMRKTVEKSVDQNDHPGFLCQHELEITPFELIERCKFGSTSSKWEGIESLMETDSYCFICLGTNLAHIVPKQRIEEGNLQIFLQKLRSKLNQVEGNTNWFLENK